MSERRILVSPQFPPIRFHDFDYSAVREGYEGGDPMGFGPTAEAAIADLREQEESK